MGSGFCAVGQSRTPTAMVAANWRKRFVPAPGRFFILKPNEMPWYSWQKSATSWSIDNRKHAHPKTLVLDLISCVPRLFSEAVDRVDYAVTLARCWAVDRIYGPEPPTPADLKREANTTN
jgi:hypothetical protein